MIDIITPFVVLTVAKFCQIVSSLNTIMHEYESLRSSEILMVHSAGMSDDQH